MYDSLTSDRPYRTPSSKEKTQNYIRGLAGTQFDPDIVEVFLKMMEEEARQPEGWTINEEGPVCNEFHVVGTCAKMGFPVCLS